MENENSWTVRKREKKKREREREGKWRGKREGGKRRTRVGEPVEESGGEGTRTRGRPRSCVAQRETFNFVTLGLNYHAETIVPGKIKKGSLRSARRWAPRRRCSPLQDHAQSSWGEERESEERGSWNTERDERTEGRRARKDNDEIPFSSAEPVVALGLTRLRLVEQEKKRGRGKK